MTKLNEKARKQALATGITPLDYMLAILRDEAKSQVDRFEAAKAAAPYVHARLANVEHKGEMIHRYVARLPEKAAETETWQQQHAPTILQ